MDQQSRQGWSTDSLIAVVAVAVFGLVVVSALAERFRRWGVLLPSGAGLVDLPFRLGGLDGPRLLIGGFAVIALIGVVRVGIRAARTDRRGSSEPAP